MLLFGRCGVAQRRTSLPGVDTETRRETTAEQSPRGRRHAGPAGTPPHDVREEDEAGK
jgi:hypothetical protein